VISSRTGLHVDWGTSTARPQEHPQVEGGWCGGGGGVWGVQTLQPAGVERVVRWAGGDCD